MQTTALQQVILQHFGMVVRILLKEVLTLIIWQRLFKVTSCFFLSYKSFNKPWSRHCRFKLTQLHLQVSVFPLPHFQIQIKLQQEPLGKGEAKYVLWIGEPAIHGLFLLHQLRAALLLGLMEGPEAMILMMLVQALMVAMLMTWWATFCWPKRWYFKLTLWLLEHYWGFQRLI